jgi:Zn-dependent M28 family amino/carboxypeptidase
MKKIKNISLIILLGFLFVIRTNAKDDNALVKELEQHVKYLASDELQGRKPGTKGGDMAADYIAAEFQKLGLKPIKGSYKQNFKIRTGFKLGPGNNLSFDNLIPKRGLPREMWNTRTQSQELNTDWYPLSFSDNKSVSGDLAFVGYGISAPEIGYDDYEGIDATGKILIMIMQTPESDDPESKFAPYFSNRYKASNAKSKGAVGIIFVRVQGDSMNVFDNLSAGLDATNSGIVAIQMNRQSLGKFFPQGKNLKGSEEKINETGKPESFVIPDRSASITVNLEENYSETDNVMALVEGTDPALRDDYIVIGAHYDHLGWGAENSRYTGLKKKIHNGADDNASGTAGILEIAEKIKVNPLKRSVVFIAFAAEEMGLLGSKYFTNNSMLPLENMDFMVNLDMVGRLEDDKLTIFGSNSAEELPAILDTLALRNDFTLKQVGTGIGPSDHTSFYQENIPAIHIFTGVHEDYHTPDDDWHKLNYGGLAKVVDFTENLIREVDQNFVNLTYAKSVEKPRQSSSGGHGYGGVWFGIVPSFEESDKGCMIGGTSPGSPAQKAGMEKDDIIFKIDDTEITNLHDFMYKIREHSPGDVLNVQFIRNGEKMKTDVKLTKRD